MSYEDTNEPLDLDLIRARLQDTDAGRRIWRSLEEVADTEEFKRSVDSEFPSEWTPTLSRRELFKLMSASLALAGATACTGVKQPPEKIVPYVIPPEEAVPGEPLYFATAMPMGWGSTGLVVKSNMGRPTKVEGNPQHPSSLGGCDIFSQASVLTLWEPNRSQVVVHDGNVSSWGAFYDAANALRAELPGKSGAGLRILTETVTSPTLAGQMKDLLTEFPKMKWVQYDPVNRDAIAAGTELAFGANLNVVYQFDKADVILSLDSDFLSSTPGSLAYARQFARRRRPYEGLPMNRLYVAEGTPSVTGTMADHRLRVRSADVELIAEALVVELGIWPGPGPVPGLTPESERWVRALAKDLKAHHGFSLVVAGDWQPPVVHALAHAMNQALGSQGSTVIYTDPVEAEPGNQTQSLRELVGEMRAGQVDALVIIGGNPVYNTPADLHFKDALNKVRTRVRLGLYQDETSFLSHWHLPQAHYLEAWSDTRAHDGTCSIIQPLIAPLYGGRSAHDLIAILRGRPLATGYEMVRSYWYERHKSGDFEAWWRKSLHDGVIAGTALPAKKVSLKTGFATPPPRPSQGLEIVFRPDPAIWDGRWSNNGWLQELPKNITKLTWDAAVLLSPATAQQLRVSTDDVVELRYRGGSVKGPIWILPGHADGSVTVHFGYGRTYESRLAEDRGYDGYALRASDSPWFGYGLEVRNTGKRFGLVARQQEFGMNNRSLVRIGTLDEFQKHPRFAQEMEPEEPPADLTIYPGYDYSKGYAWGMAIDLNTCIGCNACVVACQAENNIPVVGKDQVRRGRSMHWIRVDTYFEGALDDPRIYHEPVPCMHCENAPCELVCPVGATTHSSEGLNQMVYNRCVGTRYCSNNCPYKVRRFNFLQYADWNTASLKGQRNPEVTVRSRGVMEKCTYCIQRIERAKIRAEKQDRKVREGEIVTACQQACPTEAIIFGDLNDRASRVAKLKAQPLNYGLLTDLNTRPRTTYLARVRNPNPELVGQVHDLPRAGRGPAPLGGKP